MLKIKNLLRDSASPNLRFFKCHHVFGKYIDKNMHKILPVVQLVLNS